MKGLWVGLGEERRDRKRVRRREGGEKERESNFRLVPIYSGMMIFLWVEGVG